MPRLPVEGGERPAAPVIRLTWPGLALGLAVVLLWSFGDIVFADWLGVDPLCADRGRRSNPVAMTVCALQAGPRGWLWLAWVVLPVVAAAWWLRRKLRAVHSADERTRA